MSGPAKLTWERLAERLPLLNVAEVCRRAEIPLHRMDNAKRGRVALTEEELARIAKIIQQINLLEKPSVTWKKKRGGESFSCEIAGLRYSINRHWREKKWYISASGPEGVPPGLDTDNGYSRSEARRRCEEHAGVPQDSTKFRDCR